MPEHSKVQSLDDLLDIVVLEHLCTKIGCTTCGATEFRNKVRDYLEVRLRAQNRGNTPAAIASAVGDKTSLARMRLRILLSELETASEGSICKVRPEFEYDRRRAIMYLVQMAWDSMTPDDDKRDMVMRKSLGDGVAGQIYRQMFAHYRRRPIALRARLAFEKEQREALHQKSQEERAQRKVEIDRRWRAEQNRPPS